MPRNTTNIKKKRIKNQRISIAILAAGTGSKIRSYEPRSLLKTAEGTLLDHQIKLLNNVFDRPDIITVVGCHANRVIRRFRGRTRIVENQIFSDTNASESLRLAFNNMDNEHFMFFHGDLLFNTNAIDVDYGKSFVIIDSSGQFKDQEVGITKINNNLSIMSYGLKEKWAQIAYFTGKEYSILKSIFQKFQESDKKQLSFEIINKIITMGGSFACYEPKGMKILEIDRIKDIQ